MDVVVLTPHPMDPCWGQTVPLGERHLRRAMVVSAAMSTSIDVVINGQPHSVSAGITISVLLESLGLVGKRVAVERNREVVPRAQHATTVLAEGDRLELVTFVGGG
jgi:sulfur carrier protein